LGVLTWCFCGEFVVDCVVNVVSFRSLFRGWKMGQSLRIYFLVVGGDSEWAMAVRGHSAVLLAIG